MTSASMTSASGVKGVWGVLAAAVLSLGFAAPAAAHRDNQDGEATGHLAPVQKNVELVGKLDLFEDREQPGRIADVSSFGNYAYLGAFASPNCENGGVYVVNIADPRAPREVDFIPTSDPTSFVGEGVQVLNMNTEFFRGPVLIYNNETCAPFGGPVLGDDPRLGFAGPGGATLVDVRDPENWKKLADHVGDTDLPPPGALSSGTPHNSHSAFGWQQGDKAYMAVVDNGELGETDIDVFDITNPAAPRMIAETGMAKWPKQDCNPDGADDDCPSVVQEDPPPNGNNPFIHDFVVKKVGDRYLLLGSYWDGGYVVLDVTDPAKPVFLRDTDFGAVEPFSTELGLGAGVTPEGNAHQAEFNHDNSMFIGADEDFGPFRFLGTITSGTFSGDTFTGTEGSATPPIDREEGLDGPTQFIGQGCGTGTPAPSPNHIALMERGGCTFSIKVQTADALGYKAAVIFNDKATDAPNCDAQLFMLAIGNIPSVFVGRSTGLKLLKTDPGANSCDTPTPSAPRPGESFTLDADFDGWGYLHLYDANTMEAIDHYALPEALDESKADGFGDLSVHEVAMDPSQNRAYISYYSGGFRVLDFSREGGIQEVGAFIDDGGNNIWGVEVHTTPEGEQLVLASDRDSGLYIFRSPPPPEAPPADDGRNDQAPPQPTATPPATPPATQTTKAPTACASRAGFLRTGTALANRRRNVRLRFTRRFDTTVDIDVFQVSRRNRIITRESRVAVFGDRKEDVVWNGRSNNGKKVRDGVFFVRFRGEGVARRDWRRHTLVRKRGRFYERKTFYRPDSCGFLSSAKLYRPVFGGQQRYPLRVAFRVSRRANVTITVRRGKRIVERIQRNRVSKRRTHRVLFRESGREWARGMYRVTITAKTRGRRASATLYSERL